MGDGEDGPTVAERIEEIRRGIERAEIDKDADALGRYLAPDVAMCPAGGPVVSGVDAVVDHHRRLYETWGDVDIAFTIDEVDALGGIAVERGRYEYAITPVNGGEPNQGRGDYLYVHERGEDSWRVLRMSWG